VRSRPLPHFATTSLLLALLAVGGCVVPIAGGLDEAQANRVVVALDHAGLGGEKEADPASEGHFRVMVERDEAPRAIATLRDEDLPAPNTPGMLESMGKGSLVPSQLTEHAQFVTGLAGELERTLSGIDGVLAARVHLSLPDVDPLREGPKPKPTASVFLKHRGTTPPVDAHEIKRLVAGAAPGLAPDDVAVVMFPRLAAAGSSDRALSRLGPITGTHGSIGILRWVACAVVLMVFALVMVILFLWSRLRGLRATTSEEGPEMRQPRRA
jgi:type III secretion protein J